MNSTALRKRQENKPYLWSVKRQLPPSEKVTKQEFHSLVKTYSDRPVKPLVTAAIQSILIESCCIS
jgi:hypothetical protein